MILKLRKYRHIYRCSSNIKGSRTIWISEPINLVNHGCELLIVICVLSHQGNLIVLIPLDDPHGYQCLQRVSNHFYGAALVEGDHSFLEHVVGEPLYLILQLLLIQWGV